MTDTMRPGSGYGSGFNSTPFTTLNRAVTAPIPIASVVAATEEKPGALIRLRMA